ncbi:MAG TPA: cohesin domain-containing protein [Candidatus Hydrogenedentes bacterium]|nr:cohesin domain-containing protein [Candidatus Hydrogenedentota bacterium]HOV73193.1 cohesin domain-containing protein [Candidatus Hydrogenedentota bacterium]
MRQWATGRGTAVRLVLMAALAVPAVCVAAGDSASAKAKTAINIAVASREARPGKEVSVPVTLQTNGLKPAVIKMTIRFNPTYVSYVEEEDGAAAVGADKVVTAFELPSGSLNVVVAGFNDNAMNDGLLFNVVFHVSSTAPQGTIVPLTCPSGDGALSAADPLAARIDVSATAGAIEIICSGPPTPNPVAGWFDAQEGAGLTWGESAGAEAYQIYRGETSDPSVAEAITDWLPSTARQYVDTSILANLPNYCRLYYWVRARNAEECASDPGGPVDLVINEIPDAPTGLTATRGHSDGVLLMWNGVPNGAEYRIYRSNNSDPATRQPISDWMPATFSFMDTTTPAAQYGIAAGCSGRLVLDFFQYTYWVAARHANGCESDLSEPAQGFRGLPESEAAGLLPERGNLVACAATCALLMFLHRVRKNRRA